MIFQPTKWPLLDIIDKRKTLGQVLLDSSVRNKFDPRIYANGYLYMIEFWNSFLNDQTEHLFVSSKIHHLVDYDKKMYPVLQEQVFKQDYHRPFHGTISYSIPGERKDLANYTVMLDIPPLDKTNNRKMFAMSVFCGNPLVFLGMIFAEDFGDRSAIYESIGEHGFLRAMNETFHFCKQLFFFLDHCSEQEQYLLHANNKKLKTKNGEKHLTRFENIKINVVDSTWYTTTINKKGFKVSGHWRLQPCGAGLANRKLTWIKEYSKHGITRKAKVKKE